MNEAIKLAEERYPEADANFTIRRHAFIEGLKVGEGELERLREENKEMLFKLHDIVHVCATINMSSFNQMKDAINDTILMAESLIIKIESNGK